MPDLESGLQPFRVAHPAELSPHASRLFPQAVIHVVKIFAASLSMDFVVELLQPSVDYVQRGDFGRSGQSQGYCSFNSTPGMPLAVRADEYFHGSGPQPPVTRNSWLPMANTAPSPRIIFTTDAETPIVKAVPPAFFISSMEMERPMPANPMAKHHV